MNVLMKCCVCLCGGIAIGGGAVHVEQRHHYVRHALHHIAPRRINDAPRSIPCTPVRELREGGYGNYEGNQSFSFETPGYGNGWFGGSYSTGFGGYTSGGRSNSTTTSGGHGGHSSTSTTGGVSTSSGSHEVPEPGNLALFGLASAAILVGRKLR